MMSPRVAPKDPLRVLQSLRSGWNRGTASIYVWKALALGVVHFMWDEVNHEAY
jgi:hypothetical protein